MTHSQIGTRSWTQRTPGVAGGEVCIRNTRHRVSGLVQWRRLGLRDDEILEQHPDLQQDDLVVAWQYYEEHREEVDQAIREDEGA